MPIDWAVAAPIIVALIGACSGLYATWAQRQTAKRAATTAQAAEDVRGAANIITGYDKLCRLLREEILVKDAAIRRLEQRVADLEAREEVWTLERAELNRKIEHLEQERKQLKVELNDLKARYCAR